MTWGNGNATNRETGCVDALFAAETQRRMLSQWISSLDVVAHEHGHGIDDNTPGRISRAGTQEFVGDVFGAATEWSANEPFQFDGPDFLVGEKINLVGQGPIRNMFNPSALGDPNCYSSAIPRCTPRPGRATTGST